MKKKLFVESLKPGDAVEEVFVASEKSVAQKKDGASFMQLVLSDKTGGVKAVVWDNVDKLRAAFDSGDFVRVSAKASLYKNEMQLVIRDVARVDPQDTDPFDFIPSSGRDTGADIQRLKALIDKISHPQIKSLLLAFFDDEKFVDKFSRAPAAKLMHHAYAGGLLEHTLSVASLAEKIAGHYKGLDKDLLIAGAMLHDIGKVDEFVFHGRIDYSDSGRLLGHIVTGAAMLNEKIAAIPDFCPETALLLRHLVVSHHGLREFGSPEPPKTLEAVALNIADDLDAKITGIRHYMEKNSTDGSWTAFHKVLERHFYLGNRPATPTASPEQPE